MSLLNRIVVIRCLPFFVFSLFFIISRAWYFVEMPIPAVHPDSGTYNNVAEIILSGNFPLLGDRAIVYPVFLAAIYSVSNFVSSVILVQNIFSLISGLLLIYAIFRIDYKSALLFSIILGGYYSGTQVLEHDTAVLTESLYTSFLILSFSFLILGVTIERWRTILFASSSGLAALTILIKPGAIYLVVIYLMTALFISRKYNKRKILLVYIAPFFLILLAQSIYNKLTINTYALSVTDAKEVTFVTNFYWEKSDRYPIEINQAIENVGKFTSARFQDSDLDYLLNSWNVFDEKGLERTRALYLLGHYYGPQEEIAKITGGWGSPEWRSWLLRLSADSIKQNPSAFVKHYVVMMYSYYYYAFDYWNFRDYIQNRVKIYYIDKHFSEGRGLSEHSRIAKEFADPIFLPAPISISGANISFLDTSMYRIYLMQKTSFSKLLSLKIWLIFLPIWLLLSLYMLIKSRCFNEYAFIAFILSMAHLGNASIVSLVEYSQPRYSYPLEWTYYLIPFFVYFSFKCKVLSRLVKENVN